MKIMQMLLLLGLAITHVQASGHPDAPDHRDASELRRRRGVPQIASASAPAAHQESEQVEGRPDAQQDPALERKGEVPQILPARAPAQLESKRAEGQPMGAPQDPEPVRLEVRHVVPHPAHAGIPAPHHERARGGRVDAPVLIPPARERDLPPQVPAGQPQLQEGKLSNVLIPATQALALHGMQLYVENSTQSLFRGENRAAFFMSMLKISSLYDCAGALARYIQPFWDRVPITSIINRTRTMLLLNSGIIGGYSLMVFAWTSHPVIGVPAALLGGTMGLRLLSQGSWMILGDHITIPTREWYNRLTDGSIYLAGAYVLLTLHKQKAVLMYEPARNDMIAHPSYVDVSDPYNLIHLDHMYGQSIFDIRRSEDTFQDWFWKICMQGGRRVLFSLSFYEIAGGVKDLFHKVAERPRKILSRTFWGLWEFAGSI